MTLCNEFKVSISCKKCNSKNVHISTRQWPEMDGEISIDCLDCREHGFLDHDWKEID